MDKLKIVGAIFGALHWTLVKGDKLLKRRRVSALDKKLKKSWAQREAFLKKHNIK